MDGRIPAKALPLVAVLFMFALVAVGGGLYMLLDALGFQIGVIG